jgi:hypothetical protein
MRYKQSFSLFALVFFVLMVLACKKEDPCANTGCLNGGTCNDGSCACTERWTGADCAKQKTPTKLKITRIDLTKYPAKTPAGADWDNGDGPDVYVKIIKGTTLIWTSPVFSLPLNPPAGQSPFFQLATPPELTSPGEEHIMEIWDKDTATDPDDFMGGLRFQPYSDTNRFPETLRAECPTCTTGYLLALQYIF